MRQTYTIFQAYWLLISIASFNSINIAYNLRLINHRQQNTEVEMWRISVEQWRISTSGEFQAYWLLIIKATLVNITKRLTV